MPEQIERKSLSDELSRLVSGNRVNAALFTTFTFGRQFFETEVLGQVTEGLTRLGQIPITVVVDRNQYRGNGWGYQVVRPPSARLWHAKAILLMLTEAASGWRHTILGLGSANLTRSGWEENDELFSFRTCSDWCVPKVLKEDLLQSDWLRSSEFAAWCEENDVVPKSSSGGVRLLTNVSGTPIWEQLFGPYSSRGWDEAHIIAPFTERADFSEPEPGGRTKQFFKEVADTKASGKSVLHVYLAPSDPSASSSNRVVAESSPFDWLDDQLNLRMHVLDPKCKGRFHAKLFAFKAGGRWSVVAGSANATGAAMTAQDGNIEMVYEWKDVGRSLPGSLLPPSRQVALKNLVFTSPVFANTRTWNAVERAVYFPKSKRLKIEWNHPHGPHDTRLLVSEKRIDPADFTLTDACDPCLQCIPKRRGQTDTRPSFVPIELPLTLPHELSARSKLTPEAWLHLIGQCEGQSPPGEAPTGSPPSPKPKVAFAKGRFDWSEKVSRLDQSLASLIEMISACTGSKEMEWIEKLLLGVWRSHNPSEQGISSAEVAWRKWVRTAFWQVIGRYDKRYSICKRLSAYHSRWQRQLPQKLRRFPIAPS
jgi:hypothetical protein